MQETSDLYGLLAEFEHPEELLEAARRAREAGYDCVDAYTPIPVHGLPDAMGKVPTRLPFLTLLGGIVGGFSGYMLQYYASVISYPLNVGGRPLHSLPAFIPIVFETTILGAALFTVFGMLALNGLPQPHHPVFNVPEFKLASRNRFFLCIESRSKQFDLVGTREFLQSLHARNVHEVPQ
jgi:hypothetical protein